MKKIWFCTLFLFILFFCFDIGGVKAISNGTYKIVSAIDENKVLTSNEDGNIQINTDNGSDSQLWNIVSQDDGSYLITSKLDNTKTFDVVGANSINGTNVRLFSINKSNAQKWNFKSSGDGFYYIQSKINNYSVLDVQMANNEENTNIQLYSLNYTSAQKFKFIPVFSKDKVIEDGTYIINSKLNNERAVSIDNENNILLDQTKANYNQVFNFVYLNDGYYEITSYNNDLVLGIYEDKGYNGTNIQMNKKDENNTKWIVKDNFDGTYSLVADIDSYYMDISGGNSKINTNIQLYQGNGTNAQKFVLTKVDLTSIEDGIYNICTFNNENLFLTSNNVVAFNGANVELRNKNDDNEQKWHIKNIKENIYEIWSASDNDFVLDVAGGSLYDGANVQLYKNNNSGAQRWTIIKLSDGAYKFTNIGSGKNLDVQNGKLINGVNVWQYANNETAAQKFSIKKAEITKISQIVENGSYILYSALNLNKSLSYDNSVYINDVSGSPKEFVSIEYIGNGFYALKNNGKAYTNNFGRVIMDKYNESDNQLWYIVKNNDFYTFISKVDGKVLDIINGNSSNKTKLQAYTFNDSNAQKFYLESANYEKFENGYYTISFDDKYLSINGFAYNGSNVLVKNELDNNKWYIKNVGNNLYEIRYALNLNKVLDVQNGSVIDGSNVQLWSNNSTEAQRWHIIKLKDGNYKFVSSRSHTCLSAINDDMKIFSNKNNNQSFVVSKTDSISYGKVLEDGYYTINSSLDKQKVLDVASAKVASGTNVWLYSLNNSLAQIWKFKYLGNGLYSITSALNPKRALTNSNGNVQINKYMGADNQKWYVTGLEHGDFSIISVNDGLYIDIAGGKSNNGTNIGVYDFNNSNAQRFYINSYGGTKTYKGMDISKWQGNIDWKLLYSADPHFIIMRVGRGLGDLGKDVKFESYYKSATNYDIPVGVYIYGFATNLAEAKKEAAYVNEWLDGKNLDLPVFYDMEYSGLLYLGKEVLTEIAETFCASIISNNYHCGIYANIYWLNNFLDGKKISKNYPIWLAHWTGANDYNTLLNDYNRFKTNYGLSPYKYWQFTSLGKMPGITENTVDLDFGYDIFD